MSPRGIDLFVMGLSFGAGFAVSCVIVAVLVTLILKVRR